MEALAEANRQAYEGIKALAQRRNEILRAALVEWQEAIKDATGKDALSKNADSGQARRTRKPSTASAGLGRDKGATSGQQGLEGRAGPASRRTWRTCRALLKAK